MRIPNVTLRVGISRVSRETFNEICAPLGFISKSAKTPPGDRCWTRCLHAGHQRCPKCRCEIQVESLQWNEAMQALLGSIRVKCEEANCYWTGTLQAYENHTSNCDSRMLRDLQREQQVTQAVGEETRECLIRTLHEKDEEISSLTRSFENLTQMFHAAMRELRTKQKIIGRKETRLIAKTHRIQSLSRQLESCTFQVKARDAVLIAMDATILEKNAEISQMQTDSLEPQQKKPRKVPEPTSADVVAKRRKG